MGGSRGEEKDGAGGAERECMHGGGEGGGRRLEKVGRKEHAQGWVTYALGQQMS